MAMQAERISNEEEAQELREQALSELKQWQEAKGQSDDFDNPSVEDRKSSKMNGLFQWYDWRSELNLLLNEPQKSKQDLNKILLINEMANHHKVIINKLRDREEVLQRQGGRGRAALLAAKVTKQIEDYKNKHNLLFLNFGQELHWLGEVEEKIGSTAEANSIYMRLVQRMKGYEGFQPLPNMCQLKIYMGLSRTAYQLGAHTVAIMAGEVATELERHWPNVHKYKAMAHKALGDLEQAHCAMAHAVIYESPSDNSHKEQVLKEYQEFMKTM